MNANIRKFVLVSLVFTIILIGASHFAFAQDEIPDTLVNPFCGTTPSWPAIGTYELPIVVALVAENYITTDYVSGMPVPLPGKGLINDILIDFRGIAEQLIIARSIDWVLGMPIPLPGPRGQARDAAIAQALHIVKGLENKITKAFSPYYDPGELAPLLAYRAFLEAYISGLPVPIP